MHIIIKSPTRNIKACLEKKASLECVLEAPVRLKGVISIECKCSKGSNLCHSDVRGFDKRRLKFQLKSLRDLN